MPTDKESITGQSQISSHTGLLYLALLLIRKKFFIFLTSLIFGLGFLGLSFFWPNVYTATVRLVTPTETPTGLSSALADLPNFASLAGISPQVQSTEQYIVFLKSRTIFDGVIEKFDLMNFYDLSTREDAYRKLSDILSVTSLENTNVLEVKVRFEDSVIAAEMANFFLVKLKAVLIDIKNQSTETELEFLRERLLKAEMDLFEAEKVLAKFQEETGFVQLDYQSKAIIETITKLNGVLVEKIVMLKSLQTYQTKNNSEVVILQKQVAELEKQIKGLEQSGKVGDGRYSQVLSEVEMQFTEHMRNYKIREMLVNSMRKEFEMISLEKARTEASVQVLDQAVPPEEKTSPKRGLILLLGLFIGGLLAIIWLYVQECCLAASQDSREMMSRIKREMFHFR